MFYYLDDTLYVLNECTLLTCSHRIYTPVESFRPMWHFRV